MLYLIQKDDLKFYLKSSELVNYNNPEIQEKARELSGDMDLLSTVENIFKYVRDEIDHSMDVGEESVTCRASDVLKEGHGLCFAQSNLLAALLRFKDIPTGFCYQRLVHDDRFILHGLNTVFVGDKWIRLDARGNCEVLDAGFSMNKDILVFYPLQKGEIDYPHIFSSPDGRIIDLMSRSKTPEEVMENIPTSL